MVGVCREKPPWDLGRTAALRAAEDHRASGLSRCASRTKVRYRTRLGVFTVQTPDSWSRREAPMKSWTAEIVVSAVVALVLGGCATSQEWSDWKSHPTHFASGEHFAFSMRTSDGATQVRRSDIERSEERRVGKECRSRWGQEQ